MIRIENIDDVMPSISRRPDFVVRRDDAANYTSIDYRYVGHDTFDDPIRRECRGIKFRASDGVILARPLHKFFNVGERSETVDLGRRHVVTEKLDGSMVHTAIVNGQIRLMTRAGITDVSQACEARWLDMVRGIYGDWGPEWTLSFEWTSPANRIVVGYEDDRLTLLAARYIVDGTYAPRGAVPAYAGTFGLRTPRVLASSAYGDMAGLARHVGELEGEEGYVVWFLDGHEPRAVKVKAPWYVDRHRAVDGLRRETHVAQLVLDDAVDDVLPLIADAETRLCLCRFAMKMNAAMGRAWIRLKTDVNARDYWDRKRFALDYVGVLPASLRPAAWRVYDGGDPVDEVRRIVRDACRDGARLRRVLDDIGGPTWTA